jgi:hypothetical protein
MEGESVNRFVGVPLLLISAVAGLLALTNISRAADMRGWDAVSAKVVAGGVQWDANGDNASAYVEYEYVVDGETFRGDRISMHSTVGGKKLGERFHQAEVRGEPIDVFVNPDEPSESIYDREMRWGWTVAQLLIFLILGYGAIQTFAGKSRRRGEGISR